MNDLNDRVWNFVGVCFGVMFLSFASVLFALAYRVATDPAPPLVPVAEASR